MHLKFLTAVLLPVLHCLVYSLNTTFQNLTCNTRDGYRLLPSTPFCTCRGVGRDAIVLLFLALLALEDEGVDSSM